ncbi:hypothetical protein BU15DRAFT_66866 [Melanogaster broomeanus]|nr:hypothetical protein BU15DRAFT_66866 [Melanogaster broomeanus]
MSGPSLPPPLTKKMRQNALYHLNEFARQRWMEKEGPHFNYIPHQAYWEDEKHKHLIESFHLIRSQDVLHYYLSDWEFVGTDGHLLYALVSELNMRYDGKVAKGKERKTRKAAETRARKKAVVDYAVKESSRSNKENAHPSTLAHTPILMSRPIPAQAAPHAATPAPLTPRNRLIQVSQPESSLQAIPPHLIVPLQQHLVTLAASRKRAPSTSYILGTSQSKRKC